jgi:hypothetical protein
LVNEPDLATLVDNEKPIAQRFENGVRPGGAIGNAAFEFSLLMKDLLEGYANAAGPLSATDKKRRWALTTRHHPE